MRVILAEIKNAMNQMQSKLDALTARVNEGEEQISELEDGMIEKKEKMETWLKKIRGAWVAWSVKILPSVQVMISGL